LSEYWIGNIDKSEEGSAAVEERALLTGISSFDTGKRGNTIKQFQVVILRGAIKTLPRRMSVGLSFSFNLIMRFL
jgi:hypothetical protein